jgi:hypothetical protein
MHHDLNRVPIHENQWCCNKFFERRRLGTLHELKRTWRGGTMSNATFIDAICIRSTAEQNRSHLLDAKCTRFGSIAAQMIQGRSV